MDENKCLFAMNGMLKTDICHHGIKGQKWGVRRYQNPDGSLTPEGRKRYLSYPDKENLTPEGKKYFKPGGKTTARGKLKGLKQIDEFKEYSRAMDDKMKSIDKKREHNKNRIKDNAPEEIIDDGNELVMKSSSKASNGGKITVRIDKSNLDDDSIVNSSRKICNNPKKYADIGLKEMKRLIADEMKQHPDWYDINTPEAVLFRSAVNIEPKKDPSSFSVFAKAKHARGEYLSVSLSKDKNGNYVNNKPYGLDHYEEY